MSDHSTLELHADDNYILALDVSASMQNADCKDENGFPVTRFVYALRRFKEFCHAAAEVSEKGICMFSFGQQVKQKDHITQEEIDQCIQFMHPSEMCTNTHSLVDAAYEEHKEDGHDHTKVLIVTDGEPTKPAALMESIVNITKQLESADSFRLIFLTVGEISRELKTFLDTIDSGLTDAQFDIVDIMRLEDVTFMGAMEKSIAS